MDKRILIADMADALCQKAVITHKDAENFVRQFFDAISIHLSTDKVVRVKGLGTFKLVDVDARESINVQTGERIRIAGHSKVSFTPDNALRDAVNEPFAEFETTVLSSTTIFEEGGEAETETLETSDAEVAQTSQPEVEISSQKEVDIDVKQTSKPVSEPAVVAEQEPGVVADQEPEVVAEQKEEVVIEKVSEVVAEQKPREEAKPTVQIIKLDAALATETVSKAAPNADSVPETAPKPAAMLEPESQPTTVVDSKTSEAPVETPPSECKYAGDRGGLRLSWLGSTLLALLIFGMGYCVGSLKPVSFDCTSQEKSAVQPSQAKQQTVAQTKAEKPKQAAGIDSTHKAASPSSVKGRSDVASQGKLPSEVLAYPQVEGGEFLIVGIAGADTMKVGRTLINISIKHYGNKDMVPYICALNGISNPDVVPLGKPLKMPKLKKR